MNDPKVRPYRIPNCQAVRLANIEEVEEEYAQLISSRRILSKILDTSKLEMQIAVVVRGDTVFVDTETTGADIYVKYASQMFGVPEENVTPVMRRAAKTAMFCKIYGQS